MEPVAGMKRIRGTFTGTGSDDGQFISYSGIGFEPVAIFVAKSEDLPSEVDTNLLMSCWWPGSFLRDGLRVNAKKTMPYRRKG